MYMFEPILSRLLKVVPVRRRPDRRLGFGKNFSFAVWRLETVGDPVPGERLMHTDSYGSDHQDCRISHQPENTAGCRHENPHFAVGHGSFANGGGGWCRGGHAARIRW